MSLCFALISILALAFSSNVFAEETSSADWLPFPCGVADSNAERAFVLVDNEVLALDLPSLKEVWRIRRSALPVFAIADTVIAIEPKTDQLLVVGISKIGEHNVKRFDAVKLPGPPRFSRRIDPGLILNVRSNAGKLRITLALPRTLPKGAQRVDENTRRIDALLFGVVELDLASGSTGIELSTNLLSRLSDSSAARAGDGLSYSRGATIEQTPWLVKGGQYAWLGDVNNRPAATILRLWQKNGESITAMDLPSWNTSLTPKLSMDGNSILLPDSRNSNQLNVSVFDLHAKQIISKLLIDDSAQQVCVVQNQLYYLVRYQAAAQSPPKCEIRSINMRSGERSSPFSFVDRSAQFDKVLPP